MEYAENDTTCWETAGGPRLRYLVGRCVAIWPMERNIATESRNAHNGIANIWLWADDTSEPARKAHGLLCSLTRAKAMFDFEHLNWQHETGLNAVPGVNRKCHTGYGWRVYLIPFKRPGQLQLCRETFDTF